ncbi:MAG: hypothetical protein ACLS4S_01185 [Bacteroides nordii]
MNEQDFNSALTKIGRILREPREINTRELFSKLSSAHMRIDRESFAFILGWLARDKKISVELRGDNMVISEQSSRYEFSFG